MGRVNPGITAFNAGELSPYLFGRVNSELEPRNRGLRSTLNVQAIIHGPAVRRAGTRFIAQAGDMANGVRVIPFEFSEVQAYILELGDGYLRVFKDSGQVLDGASPVEVVTPWASADLADIYITQSADVLWLFHPDYAPRTLTRTSHTDWTLELYEHTDGPYLDGNADTSFTLQPGATTGSGVSLTAVGGAPFSSDCVGRHVRLKHSSTWGWGRVASVTSSDAATIDIVSDFGAATATSDFRLGAWCDSQGWPHCGVIHDGSMIAACTDSEPQTWWKTVAGDLYDYAPTETDGTVTDSSAVTNTLGSDKVNIIRSVATGNRLAFLTIGGEWRFETGGDRRITPTAGSQVLDSGNGSANVQPLRVGQDVLFLQRQLKKIFSMRYSFEADGFVPTDITQLSEHITGQGIVSMAFVQEPDPAIWCARTDGKLVSITYDPVQKVVAPTLHEVAGSFGTTEHAIVESVAAIPGDGRDELWLVVKRTIDGQTVRYIEQLQQYYRAEDEQHECFYMDSGLTFDGRNSENTYLFTLTASNYTAGSSATITASGHAPFTSDSVGHVYGLQASSAASYDVRTVPSLVEITSFTSSSACGCKLLDDIPAALQSNATPNWARMVASVSGLDHLEGESVTFLADGGVIPEAEVASGAATLRSANGGELRAAVVNAGLPYRSYFAPMRLDAGNPAGTAQGAKKNIPEIVVRVWNTMAIKAGPTLDNLLIRPARTTTDALGLAPGLFTGDYVFQLDGGWDLNQDIFIAQDNPLPMMVLGIYPELIVTT